VTLQNLDWDEMMKAIIQGKADGIAAAGGNVQVRV
jgi:DNA mismatch repair protein MutH